MAERIARVILPAVERRAAVHAVDVVRPTAFPQHTVLATRVASVGLDEAWGMTFIFEAFAAAFKRGENIGDVEVVARCLEFAGGDPSGALEAASTPTTKARIKAENDRAAAAGIFGAPTFQVANEMFWGDDRLQEALLWATEDHPLQVERR